MNRWVSVFAMLVFVFVLAGPQSPAQAADFVDVTVRIKCLEQVENPDTASGDGDYYPEVKIGSHDFTRHPTSPGPFGEGPVEDDTFCPDWRFTQNVDRTGPVDIVIRLWDYDSGFNFGSDRMDINPKNDKVELSIRYNAGAGTWAVSESDVQGNIARGDGDHGFPEANDGRIAQIEFQIYTGTNPDIDGDGIPDTVETNGVRRGDGSLVADLKTLGADPCRKSIVMWIDYMNGAADGHSHIPKGDAIQMVKDTFNIAPVNAVPCPYIQAAPKPTGIDFIYLQGKPITEQAVMGLDDAFRAARTANFPPELRPYAHYTIFVHDQAAGSSSSGLCCEEVDGGKDLIVSLGSWDASCVGPGADNTLQTAIQGDDIVIGNYIDVGPDRTCNTTQTADDTQDLTVGTGAADARVGTALEQAGTILHELGHAIGMGHGGDENTNYMPNYISNMNYAFQFGIPRGPTPPGASIPVLALDYSRSKLGDLVKGALKESAGIGTGLTDWTRWTESDGTVHWGSAAGSLDWDWSVTVDNGSVSCGDGTNNCVNVNINADDDSGMAQPTLTGYDDWQNLKFRAIESPTAGASNARPHPNHPDIDFPTAHQERLQLYAAFDPDLTTAKTVDKADAQGGETLAYAVTVQNVGTGVASNVSVTDTFPSGQGKTTETRSLGTIYPGATNAKTENFSLLVACNTVDGTVLVNSASASGTDQGGGEEANLTNNSATASTTIHAPKLTVTKTASGTGLAGETITYAVVVTNTGSAGATNVVVKDVLPVDIYYSKALDLGSGPQPASVTYEANGTTTLLWNLGTLAASASQTIQYTARTSLLFLGGETVSNAVEVTYQNANNCVFAPVRASASTTLTVVTPTRDPLTLGFWKTHPEQWTAEFLARIQATDQRFDANNDGVLSSGEVTSIFNAGGNMEAILKQQLLATYFNLATRRINAATLLNQKDKLVTKLKVKNVRDAVIYARNTLPLPVNSANRTRFSDATTLLDLINNNKILVY